jgi:cell division protein FtsL
MAKYLQGYMRDRVIFMAIILSLLVLIGKTIFYNLKISQLERRNTELEQKILEKEKNVAGLKKEVELLTSQSKEVITKIKTIKVKEYEQIKIVDSMPISGLQGYFTDRYER